MEKREKERGEKTMPYQYVVGIDVAKSFLQVSVFDGKTHQDFTVPNEAQALMEEVKEKIPQEKLSQTLFLMEATGIYHLKLATDLFEAGFKVSVLNPLLLRRYADTCFKRVKMDQVDAQLLARLGFLVEVSLFAPRDPEAEELRQVLQALDSYQRELQRVKNRLEALQHAPRINPRLKQCYEEDLKRIRKRIKELEEEAERLASHYAPQDYQNLQSIPGIGKLCAASLLGFFNRMERFSKAKEVVQFAGLSPQIEQSGKSRNRAWMSKRGNPYLRKLLFLCALTASRYNSQCRALYERLLGRGKPRKVALAALASKLLRQAFAILKRGVPYDPHYLGEKRNIGLQRT
jgi:transposase